MDLRDLHPEAEPDASWAMRGQLSPLIRIDLDAIVVQYELGIIGKTGLVSDIGEEDVFLFPWVGQYSTDVFRVTPDQVKRLLRKPR